MRIQLNTHHNFSSALRFLGQSISRIPTVWTDVWYQVCIHVASTLTKRQRKLRGISWNSSKPSLEHVTSSRFWSAVSGRGIHFAGSLLMIKFCYREGHSSHSSIIGSLILSIVSGVLKYLRDDSSRRSWFSLVIFTKLLFSLPWRFALSNILSTYEIFSNFWEIFEVTLFLRWLPENCVVFSVNQFCAFMNWFKYSNTLPIFIAPVR